MFIHFGARVNPSKAARILLSTFWTVGGAWIRQAGSRSPSHPRFTRISVHFAAFAGRFVLSGKGVAIAMRRSDGQAGGPASVVLGGEDGRYPSGADLGRFSSFFLRPRNARTSAAYSSLTRFDRPGDLMLDELQQQSLVTRLNRIEG